MNAEDRIAIQDVMARYAASIDDRDLEAFRALFDPGVEVVGFAADTLVGPDPWLEVVETTLANFGETQHMLGPPLAEMDGDRAKVRTPLQAIHVHLPPREGLFTLWGTYRTEMAKGEGGWRIVRHQLDVARVEGV